MTIMAWLPNRTNHMIFLDIVIYLYFDFPVLELYNAALGQWFFFVKTYEIAKSVKGCILPAPIYFAATSCNQLRKGHISSITNIFIYILRIIF